MLALNSQNLGPIANDARAQRAQGLRQTVSSQIQDSGVAAVYDQMVSADFQSTARPMSPQEVKDFKQRAQDEAGTLKTFDQMKAMDLDDRPNAVAVSYGSGTIVGEMAGNRGDEFLTRYVNPAVKEFRVDSASLGAQIEGVWVQGQGTPDTVKGTRYWIDRQSNTGLILELPTPAPQV